MIDWLQHAGFGWLILAALLGLAELAAPGVFLVFIAIAAAITGLLALVIPPLGLIGQLVAFGLLSIGAVVAGRRWYRAYPVETSDPLLNDRTARLLGQTVIVAEAIRDGSGRVRVGDGEWPARGPDLPAGSSARVTGTEGTILIVEPLPVASPL